MPVTRSMIKKVAEPSKAKGPPDPDPDPPSRPKGQKPPRPARTKVTKGKKKTVDGSVPVGRAKKPIGSNSNTKTESPPSPKQRQPSSPIPKKPVLTLKRKPPPASPSPTKTKVRSPLELDASKQPKQARVLKPPLRLNPNWDEPKSPTKKPHPPKRAKLVPEAVSQTPRPKTPPSHTSTKEQPAAEPPPQKALPVPPTVEPNGNKEEPNGVLEQMGAELDPEPDPNLNLKRRSSLGFKTSRCSRVKIGKPGPKLAAQARKIQLDEAAQAKKIQSDEARERDRRHLQKLVSTFGCNGPWERRILEIREKAERMFNWTKNQIDMITEDTKRNWRENKGNPKEALAQTPMMRNLRAVTLLHDVGGIKKNLNFKFIDNTPHALTNREKITKNKKDFEFAKPSVDLIKNVKRVRSSDPDSDSPPKLRQNLPASFDFRAQKEGKDERPVPKKYVMDSTGLAPEISTSNQAEDVTICKLGTTSGPDAAKTPPSDSPGPQVPYSEPEDQPEFVTCPIGMSSLGSDSFKSCSSSNNGNSVSENESAAVDNTDTVGLVGTGNLGDTTYCIGAAPKSGGNDKVPNVSARGSVRVTNAETISAIDAEPPSGPDQTLAVLELTEEYDESFEMSFLCWSEEPVEEQAKGSYDITLYEDLNEDNSHRADKVLPEWASNREFLGEELYTLNPSMTGNEMDDMIFPPMPKFNLFPDATMSRRKP